MAGRSRVQHQMPVVGHQAVGQNSHWVAQMSLDQNPLESVVVLGLLQQGQPGHRPVEDVVHQTARGNAGLSRHERQHSPADATCQNELRPLFFPSADGRPARRAAAGLDSPAPAFTAAALPAVAFRAGRLLDVRLRAMAVVYPRRSRRARCVPAPGLTKAVKKGRWQEVAETASWSKPRLQLTWGSMGVRCAGPFFWGIMAQRHVGWALRNVLGAPFSAKEHRGTCTPTLHDTQFAA